MKKNDFNEVLLKLGFNDIDFDISDDDFYGWSFPFHWDISKSVLESTIVKNIIEFQNKKVNIKPVQLSS